MLLFADEESGDGALSPGTWQACETLDGVATGHVQQEDLEDSLPDGCHQHTRQEARETLRRHCARMVKKHNKQFRVRFCRLVILLVSKRIALTGAMLIGIPSHALLSEQMPGANVS